MGRYRLGIDIGGTFTDFSLLDEMTGELATKTLQLCFAVYEASNERRPVDPATITGSVSPPWSP